VCRWRFIVLEWVIMFEGEKLLPIKYQFETGLKQVREELVDDIIDAQKHFKDVIKPKSEFSHSVVTLWRMSGRLAESLKSEEEDARAVQVALYRAMIFGFQVVDTIKVAPIEAASTDTITEVIQTDGAAETIREDVANYLKTHPGLSSLLFTFRPELDPTYLYGHHVETGAGLVLMLSEQAQAEHYATVQTTSTELIQ